MAETADNEQTTQAGDAPAAVPSEPEAPQSPKERRRRARSTHSAGKAREPRSPQQRQQERRQQRSEKAAQRRLRRSQERAKARERGAAGATAVPQPLAPVHEPKRGAAKERQGVVVSSKADKTITVRIDVARQHRRYQKIVRGSSTLHAHDETNDAHEGDVVRVIESRPTSKTKRWQLVEVVERAR